MNDTITLETWKYIILSLISLVGVWTITGAILRKIDELDRGGGVKKKKR